MGGEPSLPRGEAGASSEGKDHPRQLQNDTEELKGGISLQQNENSSDPRVAARLLKSPGGGAV